MVCRLPAACCSAWSSRHCCVKPRRCTDSTHKSRSQGSLQLFKMSMHVQSLAVGCLSLTCPVVWHGVCLCLQCKQHGIGNPEGCKFGIVEALPAGSEVRPAGQALFALPRSICSHQHRYGLDLVSAQLPCMHLLTCAGCTLQVGGVTVKPLYPFHVWGDVTSDLPAVDNYSEVW